MVEIDTNNDFSISANRRFGKKEFMAPEMYYSQINDQLEPRDARLIDIYSLGCILLYMLIGCDVPNPYDFIYPSSDLYSYLKANNKLPFVNAVCYDLLSSIFVIPSKRITLDNILKHELFATFK